MIGGIDDAAKNLQAGMKNISIIANNLANINTTGYKREVPFSSVLNEYGKSQPEQLTDFQQGNITKTNNPLDLAISGNGFFVLQTPNGMELTRQGTFKISSDGYLVNQQGYQVLGTKGAIKLLTSPADTNSDITFDENGGIKVGGTFAGSLLIANVSNPESMKRAEGLNFIPVNGEFFSVNQNNFKLQQGALEESNINPLNEMEQMIEVSNNFQTTQKMVNSLDQAMGEANQIGSV